MRTHHLSRFVLALIVGLFGISAVTLEAGSDDKLTSSKPIVYRGKNFDEWVGSPRVEICEAHLAETLAAIGAFGRYGYEGKVFDAVWGLVENHHSRWYANIGLASKDVASQALRAINWLPLACVMPKLKEFAASDKQNQRQFAFAVLFIKSEYGFPEEHWKWVYEQALTRELDDLCGPSWSQLLGRCDSSGKLLIRYLTELVKRQDKERFVVAFHPVHVQPQRGEGWYDWGVSSNLNLPIAHTWYPHLLFGFKGGDQTNTEHISALREFFTEVGVKSENEAIRSHSMCLLAALNKRFSLDGEVLKDESRPTTETYPIASPVATDTAPITLTPWSPSSPIDNVTFPPTTIPAIFVPALDR